MNVEEIEDAIIKYPARDLTGQTTLRAKHHHEVWNEQIEDDLYAGRLDSLLTEVDQEYEAGKARSKTFVSS
jgi:hypothetical protein